LISLGGWLRGLEISAGAIESNFSASRAKVLTQPELVNYFLEELKTLPPPVAKMPLFEKIRDGMGKIRPLLINEDQHQLTVVDVRAIHEQARVLNSMIRRNE